MLNLPSKILVVISSLSSLICLVVCSWPNNDAKCGFHIVQWPLKPIRKLLVTPTVFMKLFHSGSSQGLHPDKTDDKLSSLLSGTMFHYES